MNTNTPQSRRFTVKTAIKLIAIQAAITLATGHLYAQQVYKSVDKNGHVTYSQVPPLLGSGDKLLTDSAPNVNLPYALQQVINRYPVTLYTTADCSPCINAKLMLTQRGVPFTERTVSSNEDIIAYKKLNGDNNFPLATIATQQLKGYEDSEWTKYLDAAGYPKTSALPRSYRNPEPTALTQKKPVDKLEKIEEVKPALTQPRPAPISNNNPAGIRF